MLEAKQEPIYILHTRAYRETSCLVDAISLNHGRVALVAKGVRGKRKSSLCIFPHRPLLASFKGKGELFNLTHCEEQTVVPMLTGDALACGMYLNELTIRALPKGMGSDDFFHTYALSLHALIQGKRFNLSLRMFERALLEELHGKTDLTHCYNTETPVIADKHYVIEQGQVYAAKTGFLGQTLLDLTNDNLAQNHGGQMRLLLSHLLKPYMGDKPLQSKVLLQGKDK